MNVFHNEQLGISSTEPRRSVCSRARALVIALSEGATNAILLMDERAGRAIAHEHGLQVAGTAAVIGFARKHGLIESARGSFERLHASDFRISAEVIQTVLRRVGEL